MQTLTYARAKAILAGLLLVVTLTTVSASSSAFSFDGSFSRAHGYQPDDASVVDGRLLADTAAATNETVVEVDPDVNTVSPARARDRIFLLRAF